MRDEAANQNIARLRLTDFDLGVLAAIRMGAVKATFVRLGPSRRHTWVFTRGEQDVTVSVSRLLDAREVVVADMVRPQDFVTLNVWRQGVSR